MKEHSTGWWRQLLTRWWVVALFGIFVLLLDLWVDTMPAQQSRLSIIRDGDIIALFLISLGFLFGLYIQKNASEKSALKRISSQYKLSVDLASAKDFEAINSIASSFIATFLDLALSALYISNGYGSRLHKVSQWMSDQIPLPDKLMDPHSEFCETCRQIQVLNGKIPTCTAPILINDRDPNDLAHYCLPLQIEEQTIGLLRISIDQNRPLSVTQTGQLLSIIPLLAVVVQSGILRQATMAETVTTAKQAERRSLSHDLHDTLGQNLSYIRLKLDHMTRNHSQAQPAKFQKDLDHMLMVASESCELVRETLIILNPDESPPMGKILREYCEIVGERSNLAIEFSTQGDPIYLSQHSARQIFYLFREALSNIEKHANATRMVVSMSWTEKDLEISISDNGSGFDTTASPQDGHYGIKSMSQRVEEMRGKLTINSTPKVGTSLFFCFPARDLSEENIEESSM